MKGLTKKKPEKQLLQYIGKKGGRSKGKITIRHRGGGKRKLYRMVEFGERNIGMKGKVVALEYDPNRNAAIALVEYEDGTKSYILAAHEMKVGHEVLTAEQAPANIGNRMRLLSIPVGTMIYNIEVEPGKGGKLVRGAGGTAKILAHDAGYTQVLLPSSEVRKISSQCYASIGMVSNPEHRYRVIGKAGTARLMGQRPRVRGTAMNPVDHPHGGGEGRTGRGMKHPKTPWGKPALGVKTRKKKWSDKLIIQRRIKKKRK